MHQELMERVVDPDNAQRALAAVKRNQGAAGIDGMTTEQLEAHVQRHGEAIRAKLLAGSWTPSPVKRVEMPKPNGETRKLGIPTVIDRWVQQMLLGVLQPIFDPRMSEHSYGFRPQRSAHDAIKQAQRYVQQGYTWVVDIDITAFFDHVHHDLLMHRIGAVIRDKRVLKVIGRYLRAGVMVNGVVIDNAEGTPQGGPLSPLLANIYLDAWDQELARRGLAFCRYADDCNIYVRSERAAQRVMENNTDWLKKQLRLSVNPTKSAIGRPWERKFLGFCINVQGEIEVASTAIKRFKDRVRQLWRSCQSLSSAQLRDRWRAYLKGWWAYFRLADNPKPIRDLDGWIRRHMRKCFWLRWHNAAGRRNALRRLKVTGRLLKSAYSSHGAWRIARCGAMHTALNKRVLRRYGLIVPSDLVAV